MNVSLILQKRCTSRWDRYQRKTLFVVDVSINWAVYRHLQIKILDTWKVTQLSSLRQGSVNPRWPRHCSSYQSCCVCNMPPVCGSVRVRYPKTMTTLKCKRSPRHTGSGVWCMKHHRRIVAKLSKLRTTFALQTGYNGRQVWFDWHLSSDVSCLRFLVLKATPVATSPAEWMSTFLLLSSVLFAWSPEVVSPETLKSLTVLRRPTTSAQSFGQGRHTCVSCSPTVM